MIQFASLRPQRALLRTVQNQDRVSGGRTFSLGSVAVKPDGSLIIKENGIIGIGDQMNSWAGITVLQV
jgi:hypothetical protein